MVDTIDSPDMVAMISNINDNINLFMFLFEFLLGVSFIAFVCYVIYKYIGDWCF